MLPNNPCMPNLPQPCKNIPPTPVPTLYASLLLRLNHADCEIEWQMRRWKWKRERWEMFPPTSSFRAPFLASSENSLRVFARKKDGVYYRRCRWPGSDFDETRSRRGYGPKTKCRTPVLTIRVSTGCLGGSKGADFDRSKNRVFGQIFFSSNRTERFAMAFSQVFSQWLSSFKFFLDISKFGRFFFRQNFDPPGP